MILDRCRGMGGRVVGVTGPVGAGKSRLANELSPCVLSTDRYLPNYEEVEYERRDEPEESDLSRLVRDLENLAWGRPALVPVWSFQTHRRVGEERMTPPPPGVPVVVEGLHALEAIVRPALDVRVYVEAPAEVRWARWEHLETTGVRGWGPEVARAFFVEVAEPAFRRRASEYRREAHVVVENGLWRPR